MSDVLIIGGGLAGSVSAIALQKIGISATVYEAYGRGSDGVGAFLSLASNGLDALRTLGLGSVVAGKGFDTPRAALRSGTGKKLAEFAHGVELPDGTVAQTIKRADLYGDLRDAAIRAGARFDYGKQLVDAKELPGGGVRAYFADGSHAEGALLIGADGLRSTTRTLIDPAAPVARYCGLLNTGGYARGVRVDGPPGVMNFCFGRRCFFGYVLHPSGEVWWFANPPSAAEQSRATLAAISTEQWRTRLIELFSTDHLPAVPLIQATEDIVAGWNTYDLPTVPSWHTAAMLIIGDAAHAASPASGQGASMAIEDAVTLAKCLRDLPSPESAFAAYERARRHRVERIVEQGKRNGNQKAVGAVGRLLRDHVIMPIIAKRAARTTNNPMAWIYDHHIDWDEPVAPAA